MGGERESEKASERSTRVNIIYEERLFTMFPSPPKGCGDGHVKAILHPAFQIT
jgi:hypothetical protein